ncbi:uncharacterized protein LOC134246310 [Saccostrea cucullata]|uniref:uncharacterized protein LOC134246310 n=1 Tax=Saccostrea cuccullata TaxID=36930 RepID=UPI002ED1AB5F
MWLLYVTFEDLLCLRHPSLSCHLLSSRVNVDDFLMPARLISNTTNGTTFLKSDLDYHRSSPNRTKKVTSVSPREIAIGENNCKTDLEHIHALTETIDNDWRDDKEPENNIPTPYLVSNRQSLDRRDRDLNGRTIHQPNCTDYLNSMALSRVQQCSRVRDTMRDYGADQAARNKPKCFKYPNSRRDKSGTSTDVSPHGFQPRTNVCVSQSNQISCPDNRRTTRTNPDLAVTGSHSQSSERLFSSNNNCVGSEQRLIQRNLTEKNTRSQPRPSTHERTMQDTKGRGNRTQCWVEEENFRPPPKEKRIIGRQAERMLLKNKEGHTVKTSKDVSNVRSTAIRPKELFASRGKSAGELKRSAGPPTPRSETATTPDSSRQPKKLCVFQPKQTEVAPVVSPDSGLDHTILSDSFDHVLSIEAQFDDPVPQNEMVRSNSTDSSPVTISSGYESDSIQTCEAEIDKIFVNNKSRMGNLTNVSSVTAFPNSSLHASAMDLSSSIFQSVPFSNGADNISEKLNQSFVSSKSRTPEKPTGVLDRSFQIPDKSSVRNIRATETDFQSLPIFPRSQPEPTAPRFSPVQRHNHKLTKVARSMFEIINDLQLENESPKKNPGNNKRCKKVKRANPVRAENATLIKNNFQRSSMESLDENRLCISEESISSADKADATLGVNAKSDCVPDHTPGVKSEPIVSENNNDIQSKRHTDTLLLLPSTIECQSPQSSNNGSNGESLSHPVSSSVFVSRAPCTVNKAETEDSMAKGSPTQQARTNDLSPNVQPGTLVVKCLRRPLGTHSSDFSRTNDLPHSSSACYYEEYEGSPSVQPETSVHPRVPPADFTHSHSHTHPASVVNHSVPYPESGRLIIFDNGVTPYATARIPGCCTPKRDDKLDDHVYETIPGDEYLYEELMRMRAMGLLSKRLRKIPDMPGHFIPYEAPELPARNMNNSSPRRNDQFVLLREARQNPAHNSPSTLRPMEHIRNGSTSWDGYSYPYNEGPPRYFTKWTPSDLLSYVDGIRQPAPKRRENFYLLLNNKQKRADFSESLEIETKLKNMGLLWGDRSQPPTPDQSDRSASIEFTGDSGQPFLQSTYV